MPKGHRVHQRSEPEPCRLQATGPQGSPLRPHRRRKRNSNLRSLSSGSSKSVGDDRICSAIGRYDLRSNRAQTGDGFRLRTLRTAP
jgi:hypothetical protein